MKKSKIILFILLIAGPILYIDTDHPVVQGFVDEWGRNQYLSYEINHARSRLVSEFVNDVVSPKVDLAQSIMGESDRWLDAPNNRLKFILSLAKTDPDLAFEKSVYVLSLACTIQMVFDREDPFKVLKSEESRFLALPTYHQKYYGLGKEKAQSEAEECKSRLWRASIATTASQLDQITARNRESSQLLGVSVSNRITP